MLRRAEDPVKAPLQPQRQFADVEYSSQRRHTRRGLTLKRMDALLPWAYRALTFS